MQEESDCHEDQPVCGRWMEMMSESPYDCPEEFHAHMASCPSCLSSWMELREVWEALALDTDDFEVPEDLKKEVMEAVFGDEPIRSAADTEFLQAAHSREDDSGRDLGHKPVTNGSGRGAASFRIRLYRKSTYVAAALLLLLGTLFSWKTFIHRPDPAAVAIQKDPIVAPTTSAAVNESWKLVSFQSDKPEIAGHATLVSYGTSSTMVIEMSGLQATSGDQAYQAWLLHDGKRYNCGTFKVSQDGKGMLTYKIAGPYLEIDGIGITLEPDAQGTSPRGPKVAGTAKTG